jgi:hydrogenase maturation protease
MPSMRWLVLGLGNALAGADGFGPAVIARLRRTPGLDGVALVDAHTDLLAHLDRFDAADDVLLIDTVLDDRGGVALVDEDEFSAWDHTSRGAHQVSPLAAVKLFRRLHPGAATRIRLVAQFVREQDFSLPPDDDAVTTAADLIRRVCLSSPRYVTPG